MTEKLDFSGQLAQQQIVVAPGIYDGLGAVLVERSRARLRNRLNEAEAFTSISFEIFQKKYYLQTFTRSGKLSRVSRGKIFLLTFPARFF